MKFKKPSFWQSKKNNFLLKIFYPLTIPLILSNLYSNIKNKKKFDNIKSICVGNIYVGGTGKTPLTIELFNILRKLKYKTCVARKFYNEYLDEQIILERKTNLIISKKRSMAFKKAISEKMDVIIFDDGLQDKSVDYDIKLVCFNSKSWLGNGHLLPLGPLREKINSLKKYDAVILNGDDQNLEMIKTEIKKINNNIKIFNTKYIPSNLNKLKKDLYYLIFSGIGHPESFKQILINNGINVKKELVFPDHHEYSKRDIDQILLEAKKNNLKVLTTEKDFVKISKNQTDEIRSLEIDLKIFEEKNLIKLIETKINA